MSALIETLNKMHRPRLLIRAARYGMQEYSRNRDLRRILKGDSLPAPTSALTRLIDMEVTQEETRQRGDAAYSVSTHLEILIAIMSEARLIGAGKTAFQP